MASVKASKPKSVSTSTDIVNDIMTIIESYENRFEDNKRMANLTKYIVPILKVFAEQRDMKAIFKLARIYTSLYVDFEDNAILAKSYLDKSIEMYKLAVELNDPTGQAAFELFGLLTNEKEDPQSGRKYLDIALQKENVDMIEMVLNNPQEFDIVIDIETAKHYFDILIKDEKSEIALAYYTIINYLFRIKNYELMKEYIEKVEKLPAEKQKERHYFISNVYNTAASYYREIECNIDLMMKYYLKGIDLENARSMYGLACYYKEIGYKECAIRYCEMAVKRDQYMENAKKMLESLSE